MSSIADYGASLRKSGVTVVQGEGNTFWARHESGAMVRFPNFYLIPPSPQEVRQVLWRGRAMVASYLLEPDEHHPANACHYLCADHTYALEKLATPVRHHVRQGLRNLSITPLTLEQLLAHGFPAFRDARCRNGLNDGTIEEFQQWFTGLAKLSGVVYLGAWKDEQLAAFAYIKEVNDWAELGCFSVDALLKYRPNDALVYSILYRYLVERRYSVVSYGLSSVQNETRAAGLHQFKLKLGFEARPVRRVFVPHPLLGLLINPLTLWGVSAMLRFRPGDRLLKKAEGILTSMLREQSLVDNIVKETKDG